VEIENEKYSLTDLVSIDTKCTVCAETGSANTFKPILEKKNSPLVKQLEEHGFAEVVCQKCQDKS
jgi:iron uptake system EfeUOB component EfeO/EfeM